MKEYEPSDYAKKCTQTAQKMGDILYKDAEENDEARLKYVTLALSSLISHDMLMRAKSIDIDIRELYAKFLQDLNKFFELFVSITADDPSEN